MINNVREQEDQLASIAKSQGIDLDKFQTEYPEKVIVTNYMLEHVFYTAALKKNQLYALSIFIDYSERNGYKTAFSIQPVIDSRTIDMHNYFSTKIRCGNSLIKKEKFTEQIIFVNLLESSKKWIASEVFRGTIVVIKHRTGWINVFLKKNNGYINLEDNQMISSLPSDSEYTINEYALEPTQASRSRNLSGVFRNITIEDKRFEIFDDATHGALSKLKADFKDSLLKVRCDADLIELKKKAKRAYGYIGNVQTGSVNLGTVPGFHVYHGKWTNTTREYFLHKDFISTIEKLSEAMQKNEKSEVLNDLSERLELMKENKVLENAPTQDGQLYVNVVSLCEMIFKHLGYLVHPKLLVGRILQIRPATIKASSVIVEDSVYKQFVKGSASLAKKNGVEVKHYGKDDESLFITDMNCIKMDFNMEEEFSFELLALNKCSQSGSSKQIYKNIMYAYEKKGKLDDCMKLIKESLNISVSKTISRAMTVGAAKEPSFQDIETALKSGYYINVINKIAPAYKYQSNAIMESSWKQAITPAVDIIDRMRGDLVMESRRLVSDPTFILSGGKLPGILKLGESFINDKRIRKSVMFKYPVAGLEEQYASVNVTVGKIATRSKKLFKRGIITEAERRAIIDFFASLSSTVRVLPALMYLANACAGLDFDYDGECSMIYTTSPTTRGEEITNEFIDTIFNSEIRGVNIIQN